MTNRLSPKEMAEFSRLTARGIPLDGEAVEKLQASSYGLEVCQTCYGETEVVELDRSEAAVVVSIGIQNSPGGVLTIGQYRLELPWTAWTEVHWLEKPPKKLYGYQMSAPPLLHPYAREEVLNHRVGSRGKLFPGDLLEGLLLGICKDPIPTEYAHGQIVRTRLWVFDTRGNGYRCKVGLRVKRSEPKSLPKKVGAPRARRNITAAP